VGEGQREREREREREKVDRAGGQIKREEKSIDI